MKNFRSKRHAKLRWHRMAVRYNNGGTWNVDGGVIQKATFKIRLYLGWSNTIGELRKMPENARDALYL